MRQLSILSLTLALAACGGGNVDEQLLEIRHAEDHRLASSVETLTQYLTDGSPPIRMAAARAMGRIGHPSARAALESTVRDDRRPEVRAEAAFALGILADPAATPTLVRQLSQEDDARALGEIALALGRLGDEGAVSPLLPLVERGHPHVREQALESLALLADSTSVQTLIAATEDPMEGIRWRAAYALEKIPTQDQVPRLRELTRDSSSLVRRYAIRSLGRLEAAAGAPDLVEALQQDDWQVRVMACDALGRVVSDRAAPALADALSDASFHVRVAALQGLGRQKARAFLHLMIDACSDPVVDVRMAAYLAVADGLEGRAFANLRDGIHDESPLVAARCLARLGETQHDDVVPLLTAALADTSRPSVRYAAMEGLGHTGDRAPLPLIRAGLRDADWMVATQAAQALGRLEDRDAIDTLIDSYDHWDQLGNPDVCQEILSTLGTLKATEAEELLRGVVLGSADVHRRQAALSALDELLDDSAMANLPTEEDLRQDVRPVERNPNQPDLVVRSEARQLVLTTPRGQIVVDLFGEDAPQMVENFARLAEAKFFDGLTFHRVVPNFVIQGGDPMGTGWGDAGYRIRSEWSPRRYERGIMGIAHSGKDTGSCQLFITMSPQPHLNARYTIFGQVVQGMNVVDSIQMGDTFTAEVRWQDPAS